MKFMILGTGGVGGYFGAKLAHAGEDVHFIARGAHLAAMQRSGLTVHSSEGDIRVPAGSMTGDIASAGPADVVLVCVKSYDTESAARTLAPVLTRETIIISLQNGVDNEEKIRALIPAGSVYGGVAYVYATITEPGVITESGGLHKIVFGPLPPDRGDHRAAEVLESMRGAGIDAELSPDIRTVLWKKFIFITAAGGLTAVTRLTLGEILAVPETRELLASAMRETESVARALGVPIEPGHITGVFERLGGFNNQSRSSLYYDLTHGKPLELEALSGAVIRYGQRLGVPTPVNAFMYAALLPHHLHHITTQRSS